VDGLVYLRRGDGAEALNVAINNALNLVLTASSPGQIPEDRLETLEPGTDDLEHRVQIHTPIVEAYPDQPFSVFGA
jgi:hypothetical protein